MNDGRARGGDPVTGRDLIAWLKRTADGNPTHVCYIAADRIAVLEDDLRIALERGDAWRDELTADADHITELEGRLQRIDDAVQEFLAGDASEPVGTIYRLHRIAIGTEEAS